MGDPFLGRLLPDRERLLANGRVQVTVLLPARLPREWVERETWARMRASAASLRLRLSEPVARDDGVSPGGLRFLTLVAGVADADQPAGPPG